MRKTPSSAEIRALLLGKLYASYHPKLIVRERQRIKKLMLANNNYRSHLPVTDKFRVRLHKSLFGNRNKEKTS